MITGSLKFPFLERRNYLHGTTLFEYFLEYVPESSKITMKISSIIQSDRVLIETIADTLASCRRYSATIHWRDRKGADCGLGIVPLPPSQAPRRERYDEAAIVASARFEGACAILTQPRGVSLIKTTVPLNKALVSRLIAPSTPGQWFFTRIDLDYCPGTISEVRLSCRNQLRAMTVASDIALDGTYRGRILFSWGSMV